MKVQNIQFTHNNRKIYTNIPKSRVSAPYKKSLETAGAWLGFGVALDMVCRKISVFKSPMKNSLFINSVLALGAGTYTFIKSSKNQ